jgi:dihydroflavonol-4-reductase
MGSTSAVNPNRAMRALVTGAAGFIGSHVVKLLLDRGFAVRALDLTSSPGLDQRAQFVPGSILDRKLVRDCMQQVDYVFHLAADPNLWAADKRTFLETNFHGTRVVLEEAERASVVRLVHTSTESILKGGRGSRNDDPADEAIARTRADMPGPYCRSKFLAEQAALAAAQRGLPVVVVNPTLPVGPGDYRLTPPTRMLLDFLNGEVPGYLDFCMNLIHVRDIALGHLLAAEKGRTGERYILGHENLSLGEVLAILTELTGLPMPRRRVPYPLAFCFAVISEFVADYITHKAPKAPLAGVRLAGVCMTFDCSKARRELGLSPVPVREALHEAVAWLVQNGRVRRQVVPRS